MTEENPAAERLLRQREAVAKEFNIADINDWRVKRLALLMAAHAACEDEMATGGSLDVGPLLALDEAIQAIRLQLEAPKEIEVKLTIVRPVDAAPPKSASVGGLKACRRCGWTPPGRDKVSKCYRCGWFKGCDDINMSWQPINLSADCPSAAAQASEQAMPDERTPATAPADNVVPLQPPRRDPGSIHDAPGARLAPSASRQVASHVGSMFVRPMSGPDWSAAHPLPTPPPECFK